MTAAGEGAVRHVSRRPPGGEPRRQATRHDPIDARRGGGGGGATGPSGRPLHGAWYSRAADTRGRRAGQGLPAGRPARARPGHGVAPELGLGEKISSSQRAPGRTAGRGTGGAGRARDGSGRSPATSRALGKRRKRIRSRGRDPRAHASQPAPLGAPPRRSSAHGPPHPGATATQKTGRRKGRPPPGTHAGRHAAGPGRPTPARTGGAAFRVPSPGVGTWRKKAAEAPRTNGRTPGATAAGAAEP